MTSVRKNGRKQERKLPTLLPPRIAPFPPEFQRYAEDDPTPRGDQSIVLDEEDERILDKVWAEVARYPQASAPDASEQAASLGNGPSHHGAGKDRTGVGRVAKRSS